jgi:hypothetical protein
VYIHGFAPVNGPYQKKKRWRRFCLSWRFAVKAVHFTSFAAASPFADGGRKK